MSVPRIRNEHHMAARVYRLEPVKDFRLAAALVVLMSFATLSVFAGMQAASYHQPEESVIFLQR